MELTLIYWRDGSMYAGYLAEKTNVMSQGRTLRILKRNIREVYKLVVETEEEIAAQTTPTSYRTTSLAI